MPPKKKRLPEPVTDSFGALSFNTPIRAEEIKAAEALRPMTVRTILDIVQVPGAGQVTCPAVLFTFSDRRPILLSLYGSAACEYIATTVMAAKRQSWPEETH